MPQELRFSTLKANGADFGNFFPPDVDLNYFFPDVEGFEDGEAEFPIDGFIIEQASLQSIRPLSRLATENVAIGKLSLSPSNKFDTIAGRVLAAKKRLHSKSSNE